MITTTNRVQASISVLRQCYSDDDDDDDSDDDDNGDDDDNDNNVAVTVDGDDDVDNDGGRDDDNNNVTLIIIWCCDNEAACAEKLKHKLDRQTLCYIWKASISVHAQVYSDLPQTEKWDFFSIALDSL